MLGVGRVLARLCVLGMLSMLRVLRILRYLRLLWDLCLLWVLHRLWCLMLLLCLLLLLLLLCLMLLNWEWLLLLLQRIQAICRTGLGHVGGSIRTRRLPGSRLCGACYTCHRRA
jgi:hypothetical protein